MTYINRNNYPKGYDDTLSDLKYSPDNKYLIINTFSEIKFYDSLTFKLVFVVESRTESDNPLLAYEKISYPDYSHPICLSCDISKDSKYLAYPITNDGKIKIIELNIG